MKCEKGGLVDPWVLSRPLGGEWVGWGGLGERVSWGAWGERLPLAYERTINVSDVKCLARHPCKMWFVIGVITFITIRIHLNSAEGCLSYFQETILNCLSHLSSIWQLQLKSLNFSKLKLNFVKEKPKSDIESQICFVMFFNQKPNIAKGEAYWK